MDPLERRWVARFLSRPLPDPEFASIETILESAGALDGVSRDPSDPIQWMLRSGEDRSSCLPEPSTAKLGGPDEVDGRACSRIEGVQHGGRRAVVWIENASGLILKLESGKEFDDELRTWMLQKIRERIALTPDIDPNRSALEHAASRFVGRQTNHVRVEVTTAWRPILDAPVDLATFEPTSQEAGP
jgi:hypothetical protein